MTKKLFFLVSLLLFMIPASVRAFVIEYDGESHEYTGLNCTLNVDGNSIPTPDMPPIIMNDRTLVPVRELCESFGATVSYKSKHITINCGNDVIEMDINKNETYFNNQIIKIPEGLTPKLMNFPGMNAKTMVPARFIAETLGKTVNFDTVTNTVLIYGNSSVSPSTTINTVNHSFDSSKTTLTLKLYLNNEFTDNILSFSLADPTRVVFDILNTSLNLKTTTVNIKDSNAISAIRFGSHDGFSRVVIDVPGEVLSYNAAKSGNVITITVSTHADNAPTPEINTPLPTSGPIVVPNNLSDIQKKLIVIDAGHGGSDPGAVSTVLEGSAIQEKDLNLAIALKIRDVLEYWGYPVLLTRATDKYPSLDDRAKLANSSGAAIFVSIHMNSASSEPPKGTETYYSKINNGTSFNATSNLLADNIQSRLQKALNSKNRGVKTADHAVTRKSLMPAALVEVGFISNEEEAALLINDEYQNKAAIAIADGIAATWQTITMPDDWETLVIERVNALQ